MKGIGRFLPPPPTYVDKNQCVKKKSKGHLNTSLQRLNTSRVWTILFPLWARWLHTWRNWTWSSLPESFCSSPSALLRSAISLWIFSSSSSTLLTAAFSWSRISSFTSPLCFSMERIILEKILSLSSAAASAECCKVCPIAHQECPKKKKKFSATIDYKSHTRLDVADNISKFFLRVF